MTKSRKNAKTKFYLKTCLPKLLIFEEVLNTSLAKPKTARQISEAVKERYVKFYNEKFPVEPITAEMVKGVSESSIHRYLKDIIDSGLFPIVSDNKRGYYNLTGGKDFKFTPGEIIFLATATYFTPLISLEETFTLLNKLKNSVDSSGQKYADFLTGKLTTLKKTARGNLINFETLWRAILSKQKISLKMYEKKRCKKVEPYSLKWLNDEIYLLAFDPSSLDFPYLSSFKVSAIDNVKILENENFKLPTNPDYLEENIYPAE